MNTEMTLRMTAIPAIALVGTYTAPLRLALKAAHTTEKDTNTTNHLKLTVTSASVLMEM